MTSERVMLLLDELIQVLGGPLNSDDRKGGWNDQLWNRSREFFQGLRNKVQSGEIVPGNAPYLGFTRSLDFEGVLGGPTLDKIANFDVLFEREFGRYATKRKKP